VTIARPNAMFCVVPGARPQGPLQEEVTGATEKIKPLFSGMEQTDFVYFSTERTMPITYNK